MTKPKYTWDSGDIKIIKVPKKRPGTKSISAYTSAIHSAFRGLWSGVIDVSQFHEIMRTAINRRMPEAFLEGTSEYGITSEDDWNTDEWTTIGLIIKEELLHVDSVADWIVAHNEETETPIESIYARAQLWINRYTDVVNEGRLRAGQDEKLVWTLGPTEHCRYCAGLNGIVKRASFWRDHNVQPQRPPNGAMPPPDGCGGWGCMCSLQPTEKPLTRGSLPGIPVSVWRVKTLQNLVTYLALVGAIKE